MSTTRQDRLEGSARVLFMELKDLLELIGKYGRAFPAQVDEIQTSIKRGNALIQYIEDEPCE